MDPAEKILQDALEKHQNMIRQFRGRLLHVCATVFAAQFHLLIRATAATSPPPPPPYPHPQGAVHTLLAGRLQTAVHELL